MASTKITRRKLLQAGLGVGSALLAGDAISMADTSVKENTQGEQSKSETLGVAVVQFRSSRDLADNVRRHCEYIRKCAKDGARVIVFPECSVTGYFNDAIENATLKELDAAEATIAAAAKEANAYAIVGGPTKKGSKVFNSAIVITPDGRILERYHKVQLAGERWAVSGDHMSVFPIDGILCSIIICHDERYPELVRLPALAGARIVFYISHESGIEQESKIAPYRAQIQARAEENSVAIAHANAPAEKKDLSGSHGQSRLIAPDGNIICEASVFDEEVLRTDFDLKNATGGLARKSLLCEFLKSWWEEGAAKVLRIKA